MQACCYFFHLKKLSPWSHSLLQLLLHISVPLFFFCRTYLKNSLLNVSKSLSSLSHSGFDSYSNILEMIPLTSVLLNQWSVLNPHLLDPTALFNHSLLLKILSSLGSQDTTFYVSSQLSGHFLSVSFADFSASFQRFLNIGIPFSTKFSPLQNVYLLLWWSYLVLWF